MPVSVLHVIAGPNGAGKSTLYDLILAGRLRLPFINADRIAKANWPDEAEARSYDAARIATDRRYQAMARRESFVTETVFSHPSKLQLMRDAGSGGYLVTLHVVLIPEDLAVQRVAARVRSGGHSVPEEKIRQRFRRLWSLVREAIELADEAVVRDNSEASDPFRVVARFRHGLMTTPPSWPAWTPEELLNEP